MKDQKKRIPDDIRTLYTLAGGFLLVAAIIIGIKTVKKNTVSPNAEYRVEKSTFEENLNKSIKKLLLKENKELEEVYEGTGNQVIDTAWVIPPGEARKAYETYQNKRLSLITAPPKRGEGIKEDELVKKEIEALEKTMHDMLRKYGVFYGWRIRHRCIIMGERKEVVIESDTTGTKIKEIYADNVFYKACPDSTKLQDVLKKKISRRIPK